MFMSEREKQALKRKFEERLKNRSQEDIDKINSDCEKAKKEVPLQIEELRVLASKGSQLAKETIEYWDSEWEKSLYNDMMYMSVSASLKETIEAIKNKKYN